MPFRVSNTGCLSSVTKSYDLIKRNYDYKITYGVVATLRIRREQEIHSDN